ncbi:MAG TPA: hypothetical protein DDZ88_23710 [Verrucomicrobiales bacterium]|nr:hypothetical protein [Verrucomicrobiales bacterium]
MKTSAPLIKAMRWLVFFWVCSCMQALGQSSQFGGSHTLNGTTYNWDSGSDDGTYHTDIYSDGSGGTATIRGRLDNLSLGEVSANGFAGYYQWGSINPLNTTYSNSTSYTSVTGKSYDWVSGDAAYALDLDAGMIYTLSYNEMYSGSGGSFTVSVSGDMGSISGSESGIVVSGTWYMDSSSESTWELGQGSSFTWFGVTYYQTASSTSTTYDSSGGASYSSYNTYGSLDNGTISESIYEPYYSWPMYSTSGWDPYVGDWSLVSDTTLSSPQFVDRGAPKFVESQVLWVNGMVVNWSRSEISADGGITDTFGDVGSIQVVITGNARAFDTEGAAASVSVSVTGIGQNQTGTVTAAGGFSGFDPQTVDLQISDPNRDTPLFTVATLYVDGTPFAFAGGYEDSAGNRTDRYEHTSGSLRLTGQVAAATTAAVALTVGSETFAGTFASGVFAVTGHSILTTAFEPPAAFWVAGAFYLRTSGTDTYTTSGATAYSLTLTGTDSASLTLSGTHAAGAVSGTYNAQLSGVFQVTVNGTGAIACPAEADGGLRPGPGAAALPAGFPSAVRVSGASWDFLGVVLEEGSAGGSVACYGNAQVVPDGTGYWTDNLWLLKIEAGGSGSTKVVRLTDYHENTSDTGSYDTGSRLFQTVWTTNPADPQPLPMPMLALDAAQDAYALWLLPPPAGTMLPPSFLVRGQPWRFAGHDEATDTAIYRGFYAGQEMIMGAADAAGQRLVTLRDRVSNGNDEATSGMLSGERRSVRLRDGTLALSGNEQGAQVAVQHVDEYKLHTIAADLDLVGNNLSFGILQGDASLAGALFQFADDSATASLHSILSRPQAQWGWWKAEGTDGDAHRPVMWLGSDHRLNLYKAGAYAAPAIVLDPAGTSSFQGPVRVPQSGDIPMGIYQEGDPP